jgi:hypothetical protein
MENNTISEGICLYNGDASTLAASAVQIPVPKEGRGWGYVSVVIDAHSTDSTSVALHGKLNASDSYRALTKSDQSTACSVAATTGNAVNSLMTVQLLPYMKVVLTGTVASGSSVKVWLEAAGAASRTDS